MSPVLVHKRRNSNILALSPFRMVERVRRWRRHPLYKIPDLYYFDQGKVTDAYQVFGAHLVKDEWGNICACEFALYAPNADKIYIIGEWNYYQDTLTTLLKL